MSDEIQYRCAGFVQAEIERYIEELEGERPDLEKDDGSEEDSDSGPETPGKGKPKKDKAKKAADEDASRM